MFFLLTSYNAFSINRIRLEFKGSAYKCDRHVSDSVLIESDWNLKMDKDILIQYSDMY